MRPLNLEIEGFTAYKDFNQVSFEGLQLLVLTGQNGSGKSSLLEAMIFALFGATPRMKGKQSKEFIAQGRESFRVALQFEVEGTVYRVQRKYFRKGQPQVRLEARRADRWQVLSDKVDETNKAIFSLLHMGYDAFTKAVILPQNLFDQFLKGDKEKRREVLGEILSLELYERISSLAGEKSRSLRDQIQMLEQSSGEKVRLSSRENFQALEEALNRLEQEAPLLAEHGRRLQGELRELLQLLQWSGELERFKQREGELLALEAGWTKREEEITSLKRLLPLMPKLERFSGKRKQMEETQIEIRQAEAEIEELTPALARMEAERLRLEVTESSRIPLLKRNQADLHALREIAAAYEKQKVELDNRKEKLAQIGEQGGKAESSLRVLNDEIEKKRKALETIGLNRKTLEQSEQRFQLFNGNMEGLAHLKTLEQEEEKAGKRMAALQEEARTAEAVAVAAQSRRETLARELAALEEENERLRKAWLVHELRQTLSEGETCPVCAQPVLHLAASAPPEHSPHDLKQRKREHQEAMERDAALRQQVVRIARDLKEEEAALSRKIEERKAVAAGLSAQLGIPGENLLQTARHEYKTLQEAAGKLKGVREQESAAERLLQNFEKEAERSRGDLKHLSSDQQRLQEEIKTGEMEMAISRKKMTEAGVASFSQSEITLKISSIEDELSRHHRTRGDLEKEFLQAGARMEQARVRVESLGKRRTEAADACHLLEKELEQTLRKEGYSSIGEIPVINPEEIFREEKELEAHRYELKSAREKVADLEQKLGGRTLAAGSAASLESELKGVEGRLTLVQTEIGKTRQQMEEMLRVRQEAEALSAKALVFGDEEKVFSTLQQDLQKNHLPDFLFSSVLSTILETAGEKFYEISQGRYRFALEGTGEIQVLDGWNAGEPRPVASLSGGESFAASLAVALALSEYLQGRQKIQSLFIDEGFGNLDRETRDKVAEILASLQSEEKLIGIVTHLEDLAELFPDRVVVEKLPEGSRIIQSRSEAHDIGLPESYDLLTPATSV